MALAIGVVLCAYVVGSVPTGVLIARARGVDLRQVGSGNIGATNVSRALGRPLGAVVLCMDLGKGLAAALAARTLLPDVRWVALAGLATVLGHVFPIWLRFRGGKGVATGVGVMFALAPWAGVAGIVAYALVYGVTRISSVGSLAGALAVAVATTFVTRDPILWGLAALLCAIVVVRHRENIGRLLRGEERKA